MNLLGQLPTNIKLEAMLEEARKDSEGEIVAFRNQTLGHLGDLNRDAAHYLKATQKNEILGQLKKLKCLTERMSDQNIMIILSGIQISIGTDIERIGKECGISRRNRRWAKKEAKNFFQTEFEKIKREYERIEKLLESKKRSTLRSATPKGSCTTQTSSNSHPIKKPGTLAGIIDASQIQPVSKYTPEQRIDRIHTRLVNILSWEIQESHIDEVRSIQSRLDLLRQQEGVHPLSDTIDHLSELVCDILEAEAVPIQSKYTPSKPTQGKSVVVSLPQVSQENLDAIAYIRHLRAEVLTYALSSKKKWESIGDGNFIASVWRPFFALFESCLGSWGTDIDHFSWKWVVDHIYAVHDGITSKVRLQHFLNILSKNSREWNLSENWDILVNTIQEFSRETRFYHNTHGKTPLNNILETLRNNMSLVPGNGVQNSK
jgi:hypothetical protein